MKLYHFTDVRNIESIKTHGLLSWWRLLGKQIDFIPASSRDSRNIDQRQGLHNYVRLCKTPNHPMAFRAQYEGRIGKFDWLEIDGSLVNWRNTMFSDVNAVANRATVNNDKNTFLNSNDVQAEVLVFGSLNTNWITFP